MFRAQFGDSSSANVAPVLSVCTRSHTGIYTQWNLENYRSLEAHNFFTSGFVGVVLHQKMSGSETFLFGCDVKPSWRVTEKPHWTWVEDGTIFYLFIFSKTSELKNAQVGDLISD